MGHITLFSETNNTVLFYISLNLGPKSYNFGELYGRITIKNDKGVFTSSANEYQGKGCKWKVSIAKDLLIIKTIDDNCGFGHNVTAYGTYLRKDKKKHSFFEDIHGEKIFFSKMSPEGYYKR